MQETETGIERNQAAPYQDPPGLEERTPGAFEPVTVRGYTSAGGRLAFEANAESEMSYASQLHEAQKLIDTGILSRVDVLKMGTTELLGSLIAHEDPIKKKMGELIMRGMT